MLVCYEYCIWLIAISQVELGKLGHENFIIWFAKIGILQMQHKTKQVKAWYEDDLSTDDSRKTLFV